MQQIVLNNTLNFRCDMIWSPDIMFVWYFWSILILFFLFQINMQFLFILYLKIKAKKRAHAPFFDDFVFQKIVKSLIDPLKGAAPLNEVIGYSKTCLKRTCSKADTCLKRTKDFAPKYQFTGQSLINLTCLKRTPV